jgi:hypothetical protein
MSGQNREILIDVDTTEDFPVLAWHYCIIDIN